MEYFCMEEMGFDRFDAPMQFQAGTDHSERRDSGSCTGYLVVLVNRGHLHCAQQCRNRFPTRWFIPWDRLIAWFWPNTFVPYPLDASDLAHTVFFIESRTGAHVMSCETGVGYSQRLTVRVQMMSGRVLEAREGLWAVPDAISRRLEFSHGFRIEDQRFVVGLRELVGDVTLWDQGVRADTTISLVLSQPRNDAAV
jgi:hypothetical protein